MHKRKSQKNTCKLLKNKSLVRTPHRISYTRGLSDYPVLKHLDFSDNGAKIHITRRTIVNGKIIGRITHKGKIYNVVISPDPNPDTSVDDDLIEKPKKQLEGEA